MSEVNSELSIIERVSELQAMAGKMKRHSDISLYRVLAGCLSVCERSADEHEALREHYRSKPIIGGKNRSYIEKGSDAYQVVCRVVFHGEEHNANTNRYAHALRQAGALQIKGDELVDWLKHNGGINALYLRRPLDAQEVETKCLRLDRPISVRKGEQFTVTLTRLPDNSYEVVDFSHAYTRESQAA